MSRIALLACSAGVVIAGWTSSHAAENPLVLLDWQTQGASECPDNAYVVNEVHRLVGPPSKAGLSSVVHAHVTQQADGVWHVEVTTDAEGARAIRSLEAATCKELADVAALIVALMIDPDAVMRRRESAPEPSVAPSASVSARPRLPVEPPAPVREPARPRVENPRPWSLGLGAIVDSGTMPSTVWGPHVHFAWLPKWVGGRIDFAYWPRSETRLADRRDVGGDFSLLSVALQGCGVLRPAFGRFALCAGPEVDRMTAQGRGVTDPAQTAASWYGLATGAELEVPIWHGVGLWAGVGASFPVVRDVFLLENVGMVHQPSRLALRGAAGGALNF